ncbi:hypothetical protein [Bacillus sp. AK031]
MGTKGIYQEFLHPIDDSYPLYMRNKELLYSFSECEYESFLSSFIKFMTIAKEEIINSAMHCSNDIEYFKKAEIINSIDHLLNKFLEGEINTVKEEVPFVLTLFQFQQYVLPDDICSLFN